MAEISTLPSSQAGSARGNKRGGRRGGGGRQAPQQSTQNAALDYVNKFRMFCGEIVNHYKTQVAIIFLIILNAIMMGVATFDFVTDNPDVERIFEKIDQAFLIIFTIELAMQLIYRGYKLFWDGWLFFDFVIIVISWSFNQLQIIRAIRVIRALRIITRIETMRNLVTALFDIMPRLGAITALLLLIFYIFAVLLTQLFGDLTLESGDYFSRLDITLFTLFVMMTMEWADVARECMAIYWWAWLPFVAFIMITGFIVFNLIIAVVCDAVAVIENKNDLEPDLFHSQEDAEEVLEIPEEGEDYEEELVENLAERITFVLESQREMLATLELLAKDSMVPSKSSKRSSTPKVNHESHVMVGSDARVKKIFDWPK